MKKRFVSLLMAVCMAVALSSVCFAAAPTDGGAREPEIPVEASGKFQQNDCYHQ